MRLDQALVEIGLAESRTLAQELISQGFVYLKKNGKVLLKNSFELSKEQLEEVAVKENPLQKYVSRGGLKLEYAARKILLDVHDLNVLDVGQSTGGFTDYLLQNGVLSVVGIDVGQGQLAERIRNNPRVQYLEKLNVKDLSVNKEFFKLVPNRGFDLIVVDVSFISLLKIVPSLKNYLKTGGNFLFLVKPQFELGAEHLDKNGIVRHPELYNDLEKNISRQIGEDYGIILDYFPSELPGKDGNQEFFIYGQKTK